MRIIDLDGRVIWKVREGTALCLTLVKDQLRSVAYHKVLLIYPQFSSCIIAVVRIQKQGQILSNVFLIEADPLSYNTLVHRLDIKQMQTICPVLIPRHIQVVHPRLHGKAAK